MKRFLSILLVLVLCLGVFVACKSEETPVATLEDAKTYLDGMYKDNAKDPQKDYDLVGKVIVDGVTFTVTWTVDASEITIKESTKKDFWTVDLPDVNAAEKAYVLTATIADANGNTITTTLNRVLPVFENVSGVVTNPVEGTAYKLFFDQKNLAKVLFLLGEATNADNKYIKTTTDPKAAPDFFVEAVEDGFKIYTMVGSTKTYIRAATTTSDDGKVSKYLGFDTTGTAFKYNDKYDAWYTTIDGINYVMGTYSTYDTASISDDSYYKTDEKRATQFALAFIASAEAETMTPSETPADPTTLTSIKDVIAIGAAKDHNVYTVEKYLVKGIVTEITSTQYGNMYISDGEGNTIMIYGLYSNDGTVKFDALTTQPKVGDTVTVMGIVGQYNDTPQIKNAWLMNLEALVCTEHVYTNACDAACSVCGATRTDAAAHTYANACDVDCDVCKATRTDAAEHTWANACDAECDVCKATREASAHVYANDCDAECDVCKATREVTHKTTADCDVQCDLCGAVITTTVEHTVDKVCDKVCKVCASAIAVDCKDENGDGNCDSCGETVDVKSIEQTHINAEIANIKFLEAHVNGEFALRAKGTTYADVTITWTVNSAAVVDKYTVTAGDADVTVKLVATFTCGSTTSDPVEYTVKVTAHAYGDACGAKCSKCEATRTPAECVDANKDGKCDSCDADVDAAPVHDIVLSVDTLQLPSQAYTGTADASANATVNGVTFEFIQLGNYGNGIQMRDKDGKTSSLWNTTAFGKKIVSIELTYSSAKDTYDNPDAVIFTFGNSVGEATYTTKLSTSEGVKTYTITPEGDYTFFKLEHDLGYSMYWESITITFGDGPATDAPSDNPSETPEQPEKPSNENLPQALTELKNGDVVVIAAVAYNKALSATKVSETSYYNKGVDITSGLSGLTDAEKFTVTVNDDGSYTFTSLTGDVIALADSYASLNVGGANKSWSLEAKDGTTGVFYVKNTVRGNYLEWYAEKDNWSTHTPSSLSDLFEISFFKVG